MEEGREFFGRPASPGKAEGPLFVAARRPEEFARLAGSLAEREAFGAAIAIAAEELSRLAMQTPDASAEMLAFQLEMLEDEEIVLSVMARIEGGEGAAYAWASTLDQHIETFTLSDDEYLQARAVDILDVKNRVLDALGGRPQEDFPAGAIFVGKDMTPSQFLAHDWSRGGGIALLNGSVLSHVAMLARARSVPMIVSLNEEFAFMGGLARMDGATGIIALLAAPGSADMEQGLLHRGISRPPAALPAIAGMARLELNLNSIGDLDNSDLDLIDGIGLVRTEFLLSTAADMLNEARHYERYRAILERMGERPVTIRLLDLGADKIVPGLVEPDRNSVLGLRGTRLLLARPELARPQIRALLRASVDGNLRVLAPMITVPSEFESIVALFDEEAQRLEKQGAEFAMPPVGMMVEVPAAALTIDLFHRAAFFSVGTNDLGQYLSAAAREDADVAHLALEVETALFRLLELVGNSAAKLGRPVTICGDMAGDPRYLERLTASGFTCFSVAPSRIVPVRTALAGLARRKSA